MTAKQLKRLRQKLGLTQEGLGLVMGYHAVHIRRMELGMRKVSRRAILELENLGFLKKK